MRQNKSSAKKILLIINVRLNIDVEDTCRDQKLLNQVGSSVPKL